LPPAAKTPSGTFKASAPGFLHVDVTRRATKLKSLPQMQDETSRRYLFVAIDRATRWVFIQVKPNKTAAAQAFLKALHKACPSKITKLLTDNGKDKIAWSDFGPRSGSRRDEPQGRGEQFTDRLFGSRSQAPSAKHEFDPLCHAWGIEHRLMPLRSPQANGRVERFNGPPISSKPITSIRPWIWSRPCTVMSPSTTITFPSPRSAARRRFKA
jgi:transposase InsO family protein